MPVTWTKVGTNRFKLRWREPVPGPDGALVRGPDGRIRRRARSRTVTGIRTRDLLVAEINLQLKTQGSWSEPAPKPDAPAVARLDAMAAGWLRWKATRCSKGSMRAYILHARRFIECLERVAGVSPGSGTAGLLRRDRFIEVVRELQGEGLSRSTVYSISRSGLELWRWASDDPETWARVPAPPREAKAILPRPPRYTAPEAPTLAEADACLRYLPLEAVSTRRVGTLLRFTGLRASQVLCLRREDLDLDQALLHVRHGKGEAETSASRRIPVSPHLVSELLPWLGELEPEALLFPSRSRRFADRPAPIRPELFRFAWEAATEWGEVREHTWNPPNRHIARPEHAFRATFQTTLRLFGVADRVIDALVGHRGDSVRGRHYAGTASLMPAMREAVAQLPPIDWRGPPAHTLRRRSADSP